MSEDTFSYEEVENALFDADAINEASEAHGILCGMICISGKGAPENWVEHVLGEHDNTDLTVKKTIDLLYDLHDQTLQDLSDQNYELSLLIHDDDTPIDVRIDDLCHWCQGFMYGLSLSGLTDIKNLPLDASEILQDMMDISKAGYNPEDNSEENEAAFAEIVEYIRIGAYVIYNTFNGDGLTSNSTAIH